MFQLYKYNEYYATIVSDHTSYQIFIELFYK